MILRTYCWQASPLTRLNIPCAICDVVCEDTRTITQLKQRLSECMDGQRGLVRGSMDCLFLSATRWTRVLIWNMRRASKLSERDMCEKENWWFYLSYKQYRARSSQCWIYMCLNCYRWVGHWIDHIRNTSKTRRIINVENGS